MDSMFDAIFCPSHICTFPPINCRSLFTHFTILLPKICLKTSPMPTGRTPGHLSSAIRRQALYEFKKFSSSMAIPMASLDTVSQRSIEEDLNDVKSCLHSPAARWDWPWLPFVFIAARFNSEPIFFKKEGWNGKSQFFRSVTTNLRSLSSLHGCFSCRRLSTVQFFLW